MKQVAESYSVSADEFFKTVQQEFLFLESEYGYVLDIPPNRLFTAEYYKDELRIRVSGINYGFAANLEMFVQGEYLPLWPIMSSIAERKTLRTGEPQLDDIREYAWRLRHECQNILVGDLSAVNGIRLIIERQQHEMQQAQLIKEHDKFLDTAEELFNEERYAEYVQHFSNSSYPLSHFIIARLRYAKKRAS